MQALAEFELKRAASLDEAVAWLAAEPRSRLLAGGTDLLPNLRRGVAQASLLVDLSAVHGLRDVAVTERGLSLGACVTLARLTSDPTIGLLAPALEQAARAVAGPAHRSTATLGGNLCQDTRCVFYNQSQWWRAANTHCLKHGGAVCHVAPQGQRCHAAFSGDLAPALLVLQAEVELASAGGVRIVPLTDLYRDDGAAHLSLARGEVVTRVHLPTGLPGGRSGYRKARTRAAMDFPLAGVACALTLHEGEVRSTAGTLVDFRIAITGTNSKPFLLAGCEHFIGRRVDAELRARLGKLVQRQVSPMRSTVTPSHYRRLAAAALAQDLVRELAGAAPDATRGA